MRTLIVEDDEFKASDITKALEELPVHFTILRAASVTTAQRAIMEEDFGLCILDMSLPSFDLSGPGGGGSPQGQGGLEVLRLARKLESAPAFIIVTQYPDIEIAGKDVPLPAAARVLRSEFGLDIRACVLYEFDQDKWRIEFKRQVESTAEQGG